MVTLVYLEMAYTNLTKQQHKLFFSKHFNSGMSTDEFNETSDRWICAEIPTAMCEKLQN